jgi:hypothetical protein
MANYLLGFGERLTEKIDPVKKPASKKHAYSFAEARQRLAPRIQRAAAELAELPAAACPNNESVAAVTLHPSYLAKTFFPSELLRTVGCEFSGTLRKGGRLRSGSCVIGRFDSEEEFVPLMMSS